MTAQAEIHRVLRPGGRLVVMLYARRSLNYLLTIKLLRRAGLLAAWPMRSLVHRGHLGGHLRNAEREGLSNYLRIERFVHANTDGPANPYARVYDLADIRRDFPDFKITRTHKEFMHAPPATGSPTAGGTSDGLAPLGGNGTASTDRPIEQTGTRGDQRRAQRALAASEQRSWCIMGSRENRIARKRSEGSRCRFLSPVARHH